MFKISSCLPFNFSVTSQSFIQANNNNLNQRINLLPYQVAKGFSLQVTSWGSLLAIFWKIGD